MLNPMSTKSPSKSPPLGLKEHRIVFIQKPQDRPSGPAENNHVGHKLVIIPVGDFRLKVANVHGDVVSLYGVQTAIILCLDAERLLLVFCGGFAYDSYPCEGSVARTIEPVRPRMCSW